MKLLSLMMSLVLSALASRSSAAVENKQGVLMKVDFQFQDAKKNLKIKNDFILPQDNTQWTPLGPAKDGVALLGKLQTKADQTYRVEYLVIDTGVTPVGATQMSVISRFGRPASITTAGAAQKITVGLVATPVVYTEAPHSN